MGNRQPLTLIPDDFVVTPEMMAAGRPCGECQVCCHEVGVVELGKPYRVRCEHQCATGCAVHGTHPLSCQHYACAWRAECGPEDARPDRLGVLVSAEETETAVDHRGHECVPIEVYELVAGKLFTTHDADGIYHLKKPPDKEVWLTVASTMVDLIHMIRETGLIADVMIRFYPYGLGVPHVYPNGPKYVGSTPNWYDLPDELKKRNYLTVPELCANNVTVLTYQGQYRG